MKKFSEQLNTRAQSVKLRADEKRELRERVVSYMEYHPLPVEMRVAKTPIKIKTNNRLIVEPFTTFSIPFNSLFRYSAFAAVLLLVVIPFVAEKAVPGDVLYAVKVQFNEELRSTLTFDTYQKVEWETERLNRRIAEARLLASEGRLTEEAEADVADAVRVHSANAQREIETLRAEDEDAATIASIALDSTLELQSFSLRGEDEAFAINDDQTDSSEQAINLIASAIDESRTQSDELNSSSTPPAYDKLMAKVEQNTTRIQELLSTLREVAPAEELVDVVRRVEDIDRAIQEAIEIHGIDENDSQLKLVVVVQKTQRLIVYMSELEVIKTIDIATLIPVVLTAEEEEAQKGALTKEVNQKIQKIDSLISEEADFEILAKANFAQEEIKKLLENMISSSSSFADFMSVAKDATALADDTLKLLEQKQNETLIDLPSSTSTTTPEGVGSSTTEESTGTSFEVLDDITSDSNL